MYETTMIRAMSPRRHRAILGLLGAAAVLVGCGEAAPVRVADHTLRLDLDEYRIRPGSLEVTPGALRIVARNTGRLPHNVRVEEDTREPGVKPRSFGGTPVARPGTTERSPVLRLAPGTYRLACTLANHDNLGQHAELRVLPPSP